MPFALKMILYGLRSISCPVLRCNCWQSLFSTKHLNNFWICNANFTTNVAKTFTIHFDMKYFDVSGQFIIERKSSCVQIFFRFGITDWTWLRCICIDRKRRFDWNIRGWWFIFIIVIGFWFITWLCSFCFLSKPILNCFLETCTDKNQIKNSKNNLQLFYLLWITLRSSSFVETLVKHFATLLNQVSNGNDNSFHFCRSIHWLFINIRTQQRRQWV